MKISLFCFFLNRIIFIILSEITRDEIGTASSIWAVTRIINLFIIFRGIRSMPHFTHYGIIMGTISDGMRNLKAFIGVLIVCYLILRF
jgi:hypothetical protein